MAVKLYNKRDKISLSKNFKTSEFACNGKNCCTTIKIDEKLVSYLQKIREHFGKAVTITSGYRCAKHNKSVGGASNSYHTQGKACDIQVKNIEPAEVAKYAESIGIKGIGLYDTSRDGHFVHIDTRTKKSFWHGQAQTPCSSFGADNPIKDFQLSALADGFSLDEYGADGVYGAETERVLNQVVIKIRLIPKYKNITKFVQKKLGLKADGICGLKTRSAIKAFQKKNGLSADGEAGAKTLKKIIGV